MDCPTCGAPEEVYMFLDEWHGLPDKTKKAVATAFAVGIELKGYAAPEPEPAVPDQDLVEVRLTHYAAVSLYELLNALVQEKDDHVDLSVSSGATAALAAQVLDAIDRYEKGGLA